jgi:hypothetical protein
VQDIVAIGGDAGLGRDRWSAPPEERNGGSPTDGNSTGDEGRKG